MVYAKAVLQGIENSYLEAVKLNDKDSITTKYGYPVSYSLSEKLNLLIDGSDDWETKEVCYASGVAFMQKGNNRDIECSIDWYNSNTCTCTKGCGVVYSEPTEYSAGGVVDVPPTKNNTPPKFFLITEDC